MRVYWIGCHNHSQTQYDGTALEAPKHLNAVNM